MSPRSALLLSVLLLAIGYPGVIDDAVEGNSADDCLDLLDNDGDLQIDCRDDDCARFPFCEEGDDDDSADDDDTGPDDDDTGPDDDDTGPDDDDTGPDDDDTGPDDDDTGPDDDDTGPDDDDTGPDDDDTGPDDDDTGPDDDDTAGIDSDGDGWSLGDGDCDDDDGGTHPGATPLCDGVLDNDCDALPDVNETDGDGDGSTPCDGDCDDTSPATYLGAPPACDGILDNDCDGNAEANETDGDGDGSTPCDGDCDDTSPATYLGAPPACDGILDNDCDGNAEANETDGDGDGATPCDGDCDDNDPALDPHDSDNDGWSTCDGDCDDSDASSSPGTDADGDGWSTCDGDCDDSDDSLNLTDVDGDGDTSCGGDCDDYDATVDSHDADADAWTTCAGDCDDTDPYSNPDIDADGDGWSSCEDCDDQDPATSPSGPEICDGADNDCSGAPDFDAAGEADTDADGALSCEDCDDNDGANFPDNTETSDGQDNDCDGLVDGADPDFVPPTWPDLDQADGGFVGEVSGDRSGWRVASAGDVDGDGLDDLLIGALRNDESVSNAGKTYLVLGSTIAVTGTLDLAQADTAFLGEANGDNSGAAVASAGDVDGDGLDDVLIGAPANDQGGANAGKTYLFLAASFAAGGTFSLSSADATFVGEEAYDSSGSAVSSAGDVDGDDLDDLLIGASSNGEWGPSTGKTYLFLGSTVATATTTSFDLDEADVAFAGEGPVDMSGDSVACAGDVDGDGLDDLLIGASRNDDGGYDAGKSYLILGATVGAVPAGDTFSLSQADAAFVGESGNDRSGGSLASAGDVDGDGFDDLLIGAFENAEAGTDAGKSYLVFAASISAGGSFSLATAGASFVGDATGDQSGQAVSSAGDVDGDGQADLLIGAPGHDGGGTDAGGAFLFLASSLTAGSSYSLSQADAMFSGEANYDLAGRHLASAGDVDGDGHDDLLIGAHFNNDGGADAGKAYLILSPY